MTTTLAVDGTNLLMRAVFASKSRSGTSGHAPAMMSANGENTAAMVIFMGMLSGYVRLIEPDKILVAFDSEDDLWRTAYLPDYKAHRGTKRRDHSDVPLVQVKELLDLLEIPWFAQRQFEADDLVAAAVLKAREDGDLTVILSGDKDLMQLLTDDHTIQVRPGNASGEVWDRQRVTETLVPPRLYAAYLALAGDVGDGIPGVKGVGKVKAQAMLKGYTGDPWELPLEGRLAEHQEQYHNCLRCTELVNDWTLMGMSSAHAEPYPTYPRRGSSLDSFLERYSLRVLADKIDQGVLWREPSVLEAGDLDGLPEEPAVH